MQATLTPELALKAAELACMAFVGFVALKIKEAVAEVRAEQAGVKEELLEKQNEMRMDMDEKHAENKRTITAHIASDDQQFRYIGESLNRIETKVENRNGKHSS